MELDELKACGRTSYDDSYSNYNITQLNVIGKEFIRLDPKEIEYLYRISKNSKVGILEAGREKGGTTILLSYSNKNVPIYSIDIDDSFDFKLKIIMDYLKIGYNAKILNADLNEFDFNLDFDVVFWDATPSTEMQNRYGDKLIDMFNKQLYKIYNKLEFGGSILIHCSNWPGINQTLHKFIQEVKPSVIVNPDQPIGSISHINKIPKKLTNDLI